MTEDIKKKIRAVAIIIQACNENELHASVEGMEGDIIPVAYETGMKLYLGTFAKFQCAIIVTRQGKRSKKDIKEILAVCTNASLVIGIGVAAGIGKAKLGDVLIATMVEHYDEGRVENDQILSRGVRLRVTSKIERVFALADVPQWDFTCSKDGQRKSKAITGLIASGPYLVDSKKWVDGMLARNAEAKGLEMEAHILQEVAEEIQNLNVVIIKGVCDFAGAKGAKSKEWQYTAAKAAVDYTRTRLINNPFQTGTFRK